MNQILNRRDFLKILGASMAAYATNSRGSFQHANTSSEQVQNILILVFDALSAGHISLFGYKRETTPNISRFAERSYVYHNHYSPANFTSPGTSSLLTGVNPWTHRGFNLAGSVKSDFIDQNLFSLLNQDKFTTSYTHNPWANILLSQFSKDIDLFNPVNLLGLVGNIYSQKLTPSDYPVAFWSETILRGAEQKIPGSLIFSKILDKFDLSDLLKIKPQYENQYPLLLPDNYYGMYFTLEEAIDWIQTQLNSLPPNFLGYYHLFPPHDPYRPRSEFLHLFDDGLKFVKKPDHFFSHQYSEADTNQARQLYDEFVANVDSEFGRLIDFMEKNGDLENTILILTSDHGELFERGIVGHGTTTLYQNLLRIPLLVSMPNQKDRVDIYSRTSSIDVLPTLLHITGNGIPDFIEGEILPGFSNNATSNERTLFAFDARSNSKFTPLNRGTYVIIQDQYKLIYYLGHNVQVPHEMYDLYNDPEELENLYREKQFTSRELQIELLRQLETTNQQFNGK
jgi:arylsulfatase A-like enzyme